MKVSGRHLIAVNQIDRAFLSRLHQQERIGVVALGGVKELTALVEAKDAEIKTLSARLAALEQALRQLTQQSEPVR